MYRTIRAVGATVVRSLENQGCCTLVSTGSTWEAGIAAHGPLSMSLVPITWTFPHWVLNQPLCINAQQSRDPRPGIEGRTMGLRELPALPQIPCSLPCSRTLSHTTTGDSKAAPSQPFLPLWLCSSLASSSSRHVLWPHAGTIIACSLAWLAAQ